MNRIDFLHNLYLALDGIPEPARRDMLADYEEHFRQAAFAGRNELETAAALGDPQQIAQDLKAAHMGDNSAQAPRQQQPPMPVRSQRRGFQSGCLLGTVVLLFNLIFVFGPATGLYGILFGFWCAALGLSVGGAGTLIISLIAFSTPGWLPASLSFATVLAGSVMMTAFGTLLGAGLWAATGWTFRMTAAYVKWTMNLISGRRIK